jgi:hypothetical protein
MSIFKKIGKVLSAPARGIGHALKTSGIPLVSNVGGALEHTGNAVAGKGAFLREIGKAGKEVAPVTALVPGVGPLAAGALGAGGEYLDKGRRAKLVDVAKAGALPAAAAYALGGQGYKGIPGAFGKVKGLVSKAGSSVLGIGGGGAPGADGESADGVGQSVLGKVGSWIGHHPLDAAQLALSGVGTVQGAQRAGQADALRSRAMASVDPNAPFNAGLPGADPFDPYGATTPYPNRARRAALASLGN